MWTQLDKEISGRKWNGAAWSVAIHALALIAVLGALRGPRLAVYRLPGTKNGLQSLTYYTLGSAQASQSDIKPSTTKQTAASVTHSAVAAPKVDTASAASTERGAGGLGQSGLGDGDITIALEKYFPYPTPSLSALPPGFAGDVVLDAVIDEHGKVAQLTLLQGVGAPIDDEVIKTVNQWTYVPAMKNGVPVASVQELHFHYERRG
ncbi:MAG: energy transducer TonB [Acidobacteriaceae bacterium]|jgi:protein TonB